MPTTLMLRLSCIDYLSDTNELQSMASSTIPANFYRVEDHIYSCFEQDNNAPYDRKAKRYESVVRSTLYNLVMWGTTPSDYARFAREALSSCEGAILDVGCGGFVIPQGFMRNRIKIWFFSITPLLCYDWVKQESRSWQTLFLLISSCCMPMHFIFLFPLRQ
jgi:hypothetical protein